VILPGYSTGVKNAVFKFHKTGSDPKARASLATFLENNARRLTNTDRRAGAVEDLDDYVAWARTAGVNTPDCRVILDHPFSPFVSLGGIVSRVDLVEGHLRAVLLGDYPPDWKSDLRYPLIQRAIADCYGHPAESVEVGCQRLDGSDLARVCYDVGSLAEAKREFTALADQIGQIWNE